MVVMIRVITRKSHHTKMKGVMVSTNKSLHLRKVTIRTKNLLPKMVLLLIKSLHHLRETHLPNKNPHLLLKVHRWNKGRHHHPMMTNPANKSQHHLPILPLKQNLLNHQTPHKILKARNQAPNLTKKSSNPKKKANQRLSGPLARWMEFEEMWRETKK